MKTLSLLCTGLFLLSLGAAAAVPCDPNAAPETIGLFRFLASIRDGEKPAILFGQHNAALSGVSWAGANASRSDIKTLTGEDPAVYSWDLGVLLARGRQEGSSASEIQRVMAELHDKGGIHTISWHADNPVTGKGPSTPIGGDPSGWAVSKIVPGGSAFDPAEHEKFKAVLDRVAAFLGGIRDSKGRPIPVIFRPWHESSGGWFWWGRNQRSENKSEDVADFKKLWAFTIKYLREAKDLHNLLIAYSPSASAWNRGGVTPWDEYPGNDLVDVIGVDGYSTSADKLRSDLTNLDEAIDKAMAWGKIPAITEAGHGGGLAIGTEFSKNWYRTFLAGLKEKPSRQRIVYFVTWANRTNGETYFVPMPGKGETEDFLAFYRDPLTVFGKELLEMRRLEKR